MDKAIADRLCFTTRQSPGYLVRRAQQLIGPRAEMIFADRDLTLTQWITLKLIRDSVATTSAELSRQIGHNSGATTRMIDQIEKRGLVARHRSSTDRRVVTLELTPTGLNAVNEVGPSMIGLWSRLLEDFSNEEVDMLIALLGRLVDRLESEDRS
jgi:DNA-binding MarR family transcriptional regulator